MEEVEGTGHEQVAAEITGNENGTGDSGIGIYQKNEGDKREPKSEENNADEKLDVSVETKSNSEGEKLDVSVETKSNSEGEKLESLVESESSSEGEILDSLIKTEDSSEGNKELEESLVKTENTSEDETLESLIETEENTADIKLESTAKTEPNKEDIAAILLLKGDFIRPKRTKENKMSRYPTSDSMKKSKADTTNEQKASSESTNQMTVDLVRNKEDRNSPEIVVEPRIVERLPSGKIGPQEIRVVTPVNGAVPVDLRLLQKPLQTSKKRRCFKKLNHCFLLIVFTSVVVGYAIGGAYLFSHLERKRDIEHNAKVDKWKNDTAILLATELRQVKPHEAVWARKVFYYLEVYEQDLLKASALGYRRQDHQDRDQRWTWTSSLFFSVSLMTSSGYGPMTPRSKMGRVIAMFYSLLGIPLAFSWFMVIGYALARIWLSFFQNVCCRLCTEKTINSQPEMFSKANQSKSSKLQKVRSNSIVPIEEQKLLSLNKHQSMNSRKSPPKMFPADLNSEFNRNSHLVDMQVDLQKRAHQIEFIEKLDDLYTIDYIVSTIYAILFFVIYCTFSSIVFAMCENWRLTDVLSISFLMFLTLGPGCYELEDDEDEIKMKNNVLFTIYLCIGYCILAMIVNMIYMMIRKNCKPEKTQNQLIFDSCFHEKF